MRIAGTVTIKTHANNCMGFVFGRVVYKIIVF